MEILVSDPRGGTFLWKTADGKFQGVLIESFKLVDKDGGVEIEMPAAALLAVPKHYPHERPSHNKYSPVIAQAPTVEELKPKMEEWLKANAGKSLWSLRRI